MHHLKKLIFIIIFSVAFFSLASGQKKYYIITESNTSTPAITFKNQFVDSVEFHRHLNNMHQQLYRNGYIGAVVQPKRRQGDTLFLKVEPGPPYKLAYLSKGNLPDELLNKIDYRERFFSNRPFDYIQITKLFNRLLAYTENNGYPFASIRLDSLSLNDHEFRASIKYDPGPYITFDTLKVNGNSKTKLTFLSSFLKITPGKPFEFDKIDQAMTRLSRLPYAEPADAGYLTFQNNQATYHMELNKRRVNQLDGIIGVLPNEREGNRLLITGQFDLKLYDLFSSGKSLEFTWQRLQVQSQALDAAYYHPNLLSSPLSFSLGFNLLREDTTFLNRHFNLNMYFEPGKSGIFHVFVQDKSAGTLSSLDFVDDDEFPDVLDFDLTSYGLGYEWNNLNDMVDPTRGVRINFDGQLGNKRIRRNASLNPVLYDTIDLNSVQYQMSFSLDQYHDVGKKWVLNTRLTGGKVFNDRLFLNDLYRVGGLRSLRGFNENFFFASEYLLANVNLKFYLDEQSFLLFFFDQSYLANKAVNFDVTDYPSGLGAGLNFSTNTGIFSFLYALGRSGDQPFSFNLSKIHFGYISRF